MKMRLIGAGLLIGLGGGCGEEQVQTYEVPKQVPLVREPVKLVEAPLRLGFEADVPASWKELPGQGMRVVSYQIEGTEIDFYAIKLGMGHKWRVTVTEENLEQHVTSVRGARRGGSAVKSTTFENWNSYEIAIPVPEPQTSIPISLFFTLIRLASFFA